MKKGFTLLETVISLAIIVIVATMALLNLGGESRTTVLNDTTKQIAALLREAQSDAMSQSQGTSWGVHFDNTNPAAPSYALFYGASYSVAAITSGPFRLPVGVCYAPASIAVGSSTNIIFSEVTGIPAASATIALDAVAGNCGGLSGTSSTLPASVGRTGSGKIFFDNFNRTNL